MTWRRAAAAHLLAGALALVTWASPAATQDATTKALQFDDLKQPGECGMLAINVMLIVEARDKGITKSQAHEINGRNTGQYPVPIRVVDSVFDYPALRKDLLMSYWTWECRARAHGIPIGDLGAVEPDLRRCPAEGAVRDTCLLRIRNQLLGLPRDHVPAPRPAPPAPPAPPPATAPR